MALIGLSGLYALIYVLMRLADYAPNGGAAASLVLVIYVHPALSRREPSEESEA